MFGYAGPRFRLGRDLGFINLLAIVNTKGRDSATSQQVWMEGQEKRAGRAAGGHRRLKVGKTASGSRNEPEAEQVREKEMGGWSR